jgi:hypothetical protein
MNAQARFKHLMEAYLAGLAGYRTALKTETAECREIVKEGLMEERDNPMPHFLLTTRGLGVLVAAGAIFPADAEAYFQLETD